MTPTTASLRAILVTGKGGVGKTTFAAALARSLAARGTRVLAAELVGSADADSPLARTLGIRGPLDDARDVSPGLAFARIVPSAGHLSFLRTALPMKVMADAAMKSSAIRRFLMAAPSLPEMGALYRLLELVEQKLPSGAPRYETLVVDLPATGHALALAQVPASILDVIERGPIADAVRRGLGLLYDRSRTAAFVVTLPEMLPVSESLELAQALEKHKIPVRGFVINRMPWDPFDAAERKNLDVALTEHPNVLGARLFRRTDRAERAKARLIGAGAKVLAELDERGDEGVALLDALTRAAGAC
jgi:anion-transporting  ArsA/GET3 family ATPase